MQAVTAATERVSKSLSEAEFLALKDEVEARPGYQRPRAYAIGLARIAVVDGKTQVLDVHYPVRNIERNFGTAAVLALVTGHRSGNGAYLLDEGQMISIMNAFSGYPSEGHVNIALFRKLDLIRGARNRPSSSSPKVQLVFTAIEDLGSAPASTAEAYLRLHLTSARHFRPEEVNAEGVFGLLPNVAWTSVGPVLPDELDALRLDHLSTERPLQVFGVDRFPYLVDYVTPPGVRIAAAHCVRLGACLGKGTVVMPSGFANYNTEIGNGCLVEGRASARTKIGDNSDLGGAASLMGTLSGGGTHIVTIGNNCLIGALAGTGISLGDRCTVAANLYVTPGQRVYDERDGATRRDSFKAMELSGQSDMLFVTSGSTGRIVVRTNRNPHKPNTILHKNA